MNHTGSNGIRNAVRERYGKAAQVAGSTVTGCCAPSCCSPGDETIIQEAAQSLGYTPEQISEVPGGSNLGLGCGNPQTIASLQEGEVVLDLGSGAGFDAFLAAKQVGHAGFVVGVDMTPEMIAKARDNAETGGFRNVEFRLGEIECLPVGDSSVDVIISNCVINLSPEKQEVFKEAFRVLKPGGRLAVSDIVATAELPEAVRVDLALYAGCMAGASQIVDLERMLSESGFVKIRIRPKDESKSFIKNWAPGRHIEDFIVSATIEARKPAL